MDKILLKALSIKMMTHMQTQKTDWMKPSFHPIESSQSEVQQDNKQNPKLTGKPQNNTKTKI